MDWDASYIIKYLPIVFKALPVTFSLVGVSALLGIFLGFLFALIRIEKIPVLNQLAIVTISFFRGTPVLAQMFVVYFGLPPFLRTFGIDITDWEKIFYLYITFGLNTAAFLAEVFRTSIIAVPKVQGDAAASIGLSRLQSYIRIIIPQSIIIAIPMLGTTIVSLLQESALAFTFGVLDPIGKVNSLGRTMAHTLEGYVSTAIVFIILAIIIEKAFGFLEKKTTYQKQLNHGGQARAVEG
ncbi:MAG: ABC transporter permease subunit [Coriobacteriales bacterium]|jgi:L-cystine transport system permease protein|nr:ABC transporter permease subunit [Coriobacteriales bacterium]